MLTSEKITVVPEKSGFIVPDAIAEPFITAGHKRVLLKAISKDKTTEIHVALRKLRGVYRVYFGKQHQKAIGIAPSDTFEIQMVEDCSHYGVEVLAAFQAVMDSDPEGFAIFENLTDGKKRNIIYYLRRIKSEQRQIDKSLLIFDNLKRGLRDLNELSRFA